jgi:glycosyltransferase involved in cell wall biosynthesis
MPVYNGEKYIREALDSLLDQTFTEFELIISDNASTDSTAAICAYYTARDLRIRYIRQNKNLGALGNFLAVVNEARGEYFMWAAHDDLEASRIYLSELIKVIREGDYGMVFPSIDLISMAGDGKSRIVRSRVMDKFLSCSSRDDYRIASIHHYFQVYGLFRRLSMLENLHYFQRAGKLLNCDVLFVQAVSVNLRICYVPNATKIYRIHESQLSGLGDSLRRLVDYLKVSRMCAGFWLWEADVPFKTKVRAVIALLHYNGEGIVRRAVGPVKHFTLKMIGRGVIHAG